MHEVAEKGVAAHWRYKENKTASDGELEAWVNWIRDIFDNASRDDQKKELMESFKLNLYQDEIYVFTPKGDLRRLPAVSYTHLRAHETVLDLVCRLLLEKKKTNKS